MINMKKLMLYGGIEAESYKEIVATSRKKTESASECIRYSAHLYF